MLCARPVTTVPFSTVTETSEGLIGAGLASAFLPAPTSRLPGRAFWALSSPPSWVIPNAAPPPITAMPTRMSAM
jgi:hypothetical protein